MNGTVAGVLLAGGLARRMGGGDKGLKLLNGVPIMDHIVRRVEPQVGVLAINANGNAERFTQYGLPILPDTVPGSAGPLAGVLTGLEWARDRLPGCDWVVTFPTDAPFLPNDLVARLREAIGGSDADMACAMSAGRHHPVVGLWPVRLVNNLRAAMVEEDIRKVDRWTERFKLATVAFPIEPVDPFFNANRPGDLEEAERLLSLLADEEA